MRQIWCIYFHVRDKNGEIIIDWSGGDEQGHEAQFIAQWMRAGLSWAQAKKKYAESWQVEIERCRLVEGGTTGDALRARMIDFERQMVRKRVWR